MSQKEVAFLAVSDASAQHYIVDSNGQNHSRWHESGNQRLSSASWLKNGKAFLLATHGGNVIFHVTEPNNDTGRSRVILSSKQLGPLLSRVGGDGRILIVVRGTVPASICAYDLLSLLGSTGPAKPPLVLLGHSHRILALAASTASTHIALSNSDGAVYVSDAGPGTRLALQPLLGGPMLKTPKLCLSFSQHGKPLRLAAGTDDGQVLVWDILPVAVEPFAMPIKLRGALVGVGFAAYERPSGVLLACSQSGQLCITDVRNFPIVPGKGVLFLEMQARVSCMAVRDDGMVVALGTKDGQVGLFHVEDLIRKNQAAFMRINLGTGRDVADIAFPHQSREPTGGNCERGANSAAAMPAGTASELPDALAAQASRLALTSEANPLASGASQRQQPIAIPAASAAGSAIAPGDKQARTQPAAAYKPSAAPSGAAAFAATITATTSACPSVSRPPLSSQRPHSVPRQFSVPRLAIPGAAPLAGQHQRPSDTGTGTLSSCSNSNASSRSSTPTGTWRQAVEAVDAGDQRTCAAAQAAAGVGAGASPSNTDIVTVPQSHRTITPGAGLLQPQPYVSSGGGSSSSDDGDLFAKGGVRLKSYLEDMRNEFREMVQGLAVDMVRQHVVAEVSRQTDIAALWENTRALSEQVALLTREMAASLPNRPSGQRGAPWQ